MNYRHAFHAGNFADLIKHAVLTHLLRDLATDPAPLTVIDTHAGAGLYDLAGDPSRRTGEGEAGIARLMADGAAPAAFGPLRACVRRCNATGGARYYPGSPVIVAGALRPRDRYIACELRPDDASALKQVLSREQKRVAKSGNRFSQQNARQNNESEPHLDEIETQQAPGAVVYAGDGWAHAAKVAPAAPARLLVLIDPPFERGDDYAQAAALTASLLRVNRAAVIAIWAPIKDLATYDAFLGEIEDAAAPRPVLAAEVRLRPLTDPLRLNGCAMLVVNPPPGLEAGARAAADWIAANLGEAGAEGRVSLLAGSG